MNGGFHSLGHSLGKAVVLASSAALLGRLGAQEMAMPRLAMHHFACRRYFESLGDCLVGFATAHDDWKKADN